MQKDDMIYRQAAIDALMERFKRVPTTAIIAKDTIKNLPSAQPKQKWIPCSERCPKENGYYLTSTINKEVYCDYWSYDHFDRTEAVVAWTKLPEAYAERRTDATN